MKTLTTLIAVVATSFAINVNAGSVHNDPGIGDAFPIQDVTYQESANDTSNSNALVWGGENQGFIVNSSEENSVASALQELESNPPAAGGRSNSRAVFIYNDTAGEYHLQ